MTLPPGVEVNGRKLRVWFMYEGVRRREPLFLDPTPKNIEQAGKLRARIVAAIQHGVFSYESFFPKRAGAKTFSALAEIWMGGRKAEVKKATWVKYEQTLNQFWLPHLGERPVSSVGVSEVMEAVGKTDWSALSPKRWNDALISLRGVLELAVEDGQLERNPAAKLRNRTPTPEEVEPFTLAEVDLILRHCGAGRDLIELLFTTGMRPGELIALRWADVRGDHLVIQRARNLGVTGSVKTGRSRRHTLSPRARAVLDRLPRDGEMVAMHPVMGRPFHEIRPLREVWWAPALRRAGLPARDLYATRHTYCTLAIMGGVNVYWLARQMGTSPELVYRTYGKWIEGVGDDREAAKLASVLQVP